jgi:hypothetical protein
MRQHYIPTFFLGRWANAADRRGEVVRYGMQQGRLIGDKKHPETVCYVKDGWTLGPEIKPAHRYFVEKQLTNIVDTKAAAALRWVDANGIGSLQADHAFAIMAFCSSLIARSPTALDILGNNVSEELKRLLNEEHSRLPDDDPIKTRYGDPVDATHKFFPGLIENIGKLILPKLAFDSQFVSILRERQWCLVDFSNTSVGTIPIPDTGLISAGAKFLDPDSIIALPIGPRKVLYFAREKHIERLIAVGSGRLAIATIESAVNMARRFVFGDVEVNTNILERQFKKKASKD